MRGIAYGVGVGPGDPELMTYKAAKLIRENDVIAVPGRDPKEAVAYKIAAGVVPEIADKELVPIFMPMVKDREPSTAPSPTSSTSWRPTATGWSWSAASAPSAPRRRG